MEAIDPKTVSPSIAMKLRKSLLTGWLLLIVASTPSTVTAQKNATLTSIAGKVSEMKIESLVDGWLSDGNSKIQLDDLMVIQTGRSVVPKSASIRIVLAGGGEMGANAVRLTGEQFVVDCEFGQLLFPPDSIKGLVFQNVADLSRFDRAIQNRSVEKDVVIAATSQGQGVVEGLLESITEDKLTLNHDGKSRTVSMSIVIAIVTADLKPEPPPGPQGTVKFTNGSTISGAIGNLESGQLVIRLRGNGSVKVDFGYVSMISLRSDRVVYLSDLDPVESEQYSLATVDFGWRRDVSVEGNPLTLFSPGSGKTTVYPRGIGTHAASRLEFANPGDFNRFAATVGIDAETDGNGDCEVSVWADGIKLWEAEISGSGEPVEVDVDLAGMKQIALVVRNGRHLDLGDHVDWAGARFLKVDSQ